jgi:beta-N-acetylhexosaminidase
MVGFRPQEEADLLSLVAREGLGGLVLFQRNAEDAMAVARLCHRLRRAATHGPVGLPIVAVDQELGRVCRIRTGVTPFPGPSVLGDIDRPRTTARVARWVARELGALGVTLDLAPVADCPDTAPPPSVLEGRTFGRDPSRVARHVRAWVRGSQGGGLAACAKHFPGHGAATEDSHRTLPTDATPLAAMMRRHIQPFMAAVRAGVASVMVGHVAYEALDPGVPASLSPRVIQGLLRAALGFRGLVLTDDLEMGAMGGGLDPLRSAIRALQAGADMALVGRNLRGELPLEALIDGLREALAAGALPRERVIDALGRVEAFKRQWIPGQWAPPPGPPVTKRAMHLAIRLGLLGPAGKGGH